MDLFAGKAKTFAKAWLMKAAIFPNVHTSFGKCGR
jgi:hypothetical protein